MILNVQVRGYLFLTGTRNTASLTVVGLYIGIYAGHRQDCILRK
jgi:hypothetical protein